MTLWYFTFLFKWAACATKQRWIWANKSSRGLLLWPAGMAGGCRHQGGAAPLPEGAGASDLLVWRRSPALRRKRSSCSAASFTLWSVSCLERIPGRVWRNSSRAAPPRRSVDGFSKRERPSTPAGLNRPTDLLELKKKKKSHNNNYIKCSKILNASNRWPQYVLVLFWFECTVSPLYLG